MAHMLEIKDRKASMAYAGETPWHGLGTPVRPDMTPEEFLRAAQLDWSVDKKPMTYKWINEKGETEERISDTLALVRSSDGKQLTTISGKWNPVQNADAYDFFSEFVLQGDMEMETGGSLQGGKIIWALAKVKDSFTLFGGDRVESRLLFANSHEYGRSSIVRFTPTRVVCNNTLTLALQEKKDLSVTISHRTKFDPDMVKTALGIAHRKLENYKSMAEFLGGKKASPKEVIEYFKAIFPVTGPHAKENDGRLSQPATDCLNLLEAQPGAKFARGSWWQPYNAVTFYTDHIQGRTQENRLTSAWFGVNKDKKLKALNLAVDYAENA